VQAVLGARADLPDVVGLPGLALVERDPDPRRPGVVPGGLDEQPAGDARAALGDRALTQGLTGLLEGGHHAEPARELARRWEAPPVAAELEGRASAVSVSMWPLDDSSVDALRRTR
jgi:hypothetical protein